MKRAVLLVMLVWTAAATVAQAATPHFPKDMSYDLVRAQLLRQGWKPMDLVPAGQCGWDADQCPKVPEVIFCAGAGALVPCFYGWQKGHMLIEIEGHSEASPQKYLKTLACRRIVHGDPRYIADWKCVQ